MNPLPNRIRLIHSESRRQGLAPAVTADALDRVVNQLIISLRTGRAAHLPGLGTIQPGPKWTFQADKKAK